MSTTRRRTPPRSPRPLRRHLVGLVIATGVVVSGFAAVAPVAAQAAPQQVVSPDTSTWT